MISYVIFGYCQNLNINRLGANDETWAWCSDHFHDTWCSCNHLLDSDVDYVVYISHFWKVGFHNNSYL